MPADLQTKPAKLFIATYGVGCLSLIGMLVLMLIAGRETASKAGRIWWSLTLCLMGLLVLREVIPMPDDPKLKARRLFIATYVLGSISLIGFLFYITLGNGHRSLQIGGAWFFTTIFLMGISRKIQLRWLEEAERNALRRKEEPEED